MSFVLYMLNKEFDYILRKDGTVSGTSPLLKFKTREEAEDCVKSLHDQGVGRLAVRSFDEAESVRRD